MWLEVVRAIGSDAAAPSTLPLPTSNFGSTRSRGLKLGVLELETFSASTRWRSWCHCILVRRIDRAGRSLMGIAALPFGQRPDAVPQDAANFGIGTLAVGRICRVYG